MQRPALPDWPRLLLANVQCYGVFFVDLDGIVRSWHPAVEPLFGYSSESFIGLPVSRLFTPADRQAGVPERLLADAAAAGRADDDRWHMQRDGTRVFVSGAVVALRDDDGVLRGFGFILRDRTRLLHLVEDLRGSRSAAEAESREKGTSLALLAHEIRQPLHVLQTFVRVVAEAHDLAIIKRIAPMAQSSVGKMARLVDDVLLAAREGRTSMTLAPVPVDLRQLLTECVAEIEPVAVERQVAIHMDIADTPVLHADPTRLRQASHNLLVNALKFTPAAGSVTVQAVTADDAVRISVADTGAGIPANRLGTLFQRFSQTEQRRDHHGFGGLGLGLWLVREIALAHGGTVAVESGGPGLGSRFTIVLPVNGARRAARA